MSLFTLILLFAIPLEALRIVFLSRDIRALAREKGEPLGKWTIWTIVLWLGFELGVLAIWYLIMGEHLILAGLFLAIIVARIAHQVLKQFLHKLPDQSWDAKIDEIGQSTNDHV